MILVTGANGLVGSYLCRALLKQHQTIRALKRPDSSLHLVADIADKIEWVEGDVTDIMALEEAMQGVTHLYHCAGAISYAKKKAAQLIQVNVQGTTNVVNLALDMGVQKMLHVSSIAALGRSGERGETVNESAPWNMKHVSTPYAYSKFAAEREVWRGIAEGLDAVIINPSVILGAGNWQSGSSKLFTTVYQQFPYYTEGITGYVDVRDVVQVAITLMQSEISAERFILSSEDLVFRDMMFMIADGLGVHRPPRRAGKFLSSLAWRTEWVKSLFTGAEPTITRQTARMANSITYFDHSKIRKALNYEFIPMHQCIADTAAAFLAEKKDNVFHPLPFSH